MNQAPKVLIRDDQAQEFLDKTNKVRFDMREITEKQRKREEEEKRDRYTIVNLEGHTRILNYTSEEGIQKLLNGPFYERFPRGYYQDEMQIKEPNFYKIYPLGYDGGPFTETEKKTMLRDKYLPPSEPDYNFEYEQIYGESLNEMKLIEAYNMRKRNLVYDESNFIIDIVDDYDRIVREYVVSRDLPIKQFLTMIFGEGNRYPLIIISVDEVNKSVASELNQWYYIGPVVKRPSNNFQKNVWITLQYPDVRTGEQIFSSLVFHGSTKTRDVFDISMVNNLYKNYFMIRDVVPIFADISQKVNY